MRIVGLSLFQVDLPLHEGSYNWSGGKSVQIFDSTVVRLTTDTGLEGFGEVCPLGPVYLPSYAEGARTGMMALAPDLLGLDPRQLDVVNRTMDAALKGHPYVKSAIDLACWDILGKATGLPVSELLGGRTGSDFVLYRAISQQAPEDMAARVVEYRREGYRRFQLKVGADVETDIEQNQGGGRATARRATSSSPMPIPGGSRTRRFGWPERCGTSTCTLSSRARPMRSAWGSGAESTIPSCSTSLSIRCTRSSGHMRIGPQMS